MGTSSARFWMNHFLSPLLCFKYTVLVTSFLETSCDHNQQVSVLTVKMVIASVSVVITVWTQRHGSKCCSDKTQAVHLEKVICCAFVVWCSSEKKTWSCKVRNFREELIKNWKWSSMMNTIVKMMTMVVAQPSLFFLSSHSVADKWSNFYVKAKVRWIVQASMFKEPNWRLSQQHSVSIVKWLFPTKHHLRCC